MKITDIYQYLPLEGIVEITPFNKGWSGDKKYIVTTDTHTRYLLRTGPSEKLARFKKHYDLLQYAVDHDIPTHRPVGFGILNQSDVYILMEWIDASDLKDKLAALPKNTQYALGLKAGRYLKKIHDFPLAETPTDNWDTRFNKKLDKKMTMYRDCPYQYEDGALLLETVSRYRHLLKDTKVVQHHGDFHIGNMLIDENETLYIIDFDRHDTGEPYEEFNRIVWCSETSPLFASGRINGYFNHNVPDVFWELLLLYISSNTLSSLPWAVSYGEKEIRTMKTQYINLLNDYDRFTRIIPKWYTSKQLKDE